MQIINVKDVRFINKLPSKQKDYLFIQLWLLAAVCAAGWMAFGFGFVIAGVFAFVIDIVRKVQK